MALIRAASVRPSIQGAYAVPGLMIASADDLDRHVDPQAANILLRQPPSHIVGCDALLDRLARVVRKHRPSWAFGERYGRAAIDHAWQLPRQGPSYRSHGRAASQHRLTLAGGRGRVVRAEPRSTPSSPLRSGAHRLRW